MFLSPAYRWLILALIVGVVLFLALNPIQESQFFQKSDEGYYYKYASLVAHDGKDVFHQLISWYASSDEARNHPAPIRAGYILLCAFLFKLSGFPSYSILAMVSTLSFFIFLYICFHYIRKYFDLDTALLTVLLLASSPLLIGLSRRVLIDSSANMLWGLTVWLFLDVLLKPNLLSYICFLVTFITAISFRENSLILMPFFVIAGIWGKRTGALIKTPQILGIIIYPLSFIFLFYGWIYGGPGFLKTAFMAIAKTHFSSNYANSYAMQYCGGPWFRYLLDFLLLTPIVLLLFTGYVGYLCVLNAAFDFKRKYLLGYFIFVYGVMSSLAHSKVVRFVMNLEMVMTLFAVLLLVEVARGWSAQKRMQFLFYSAVGIFLFNWESFVDLFYKYTLLDPISYYLLIHRHFIPS